MGRGGCGALLLGFLCFCWSQRFDAVNFQYLQRQDARHLRLVSTFYEVKTLAALQGVSLGFLCFLLPPPQSTSGTCKDSYSWGTDGPDAVDLQSLQSIGSRWHRYIIQTPV